MRPAPTGTTELLIEVRNLNIDIHAIKDTLLALSQYTQHSLDAFDSHFLLIHPINIDNTGHRFGSESAEYFRSARNADYIMGKYLPEWIAQDYQIVITAGHGMNLDKTHGGMADIERLVPLYAIGSSMVKAVPDNATQTAIINYIRDVLNC